MGVNYQLLFALLKAGAYERHVRASTGELAKSMGVSQQTASRWLITAHRNGYIDRSPFGIRLTQKSSFQLKSLCEILKASLEARKRLRITGALTPGMCEGKYYVPLPEYGRQFQQKLKITPYPGTLNIKIEDIEAKLILADRKGIAINGFSHQGRILGDIKCFPCTINKRQKGFVILPSRSHYGLDIIEVISKSNLRRALRISDGDEVEVEVSLE